MRLHLSAALLTTLVPLAAPLAQFGDPVERNPDAAPIARMLEEMGPDVQRFNQHLVTLANPFLEGRIPGTRGMEIAREYFEFWLRDAGTEPPFEAEGGAKSYRQPFSMGGRRKATSGSVSARDASFVREDDFTVTGYGDTGEVTAPVVFVGYAVNEGPDDYTSFPDDEQLSGKIALVFRWEPTKEDGTSRWARKSVPWSRNSRESVKTRNVVRRDAAGIIFVDPPGVDDPRVDVLSRPDRRTRKYSDSPVMHMNQAAARRLLAEIAEGMTLESLRDAVADQGRIIELGDTPVTIAATLETDELMAENVAGIIRGRGALADEWIVIGGHLDHLGRGKYGMRDQSRKGEIHPGADDNATGSAAVLMLADKLRQTYDEMPELMPARSILFIGFDAEEAGLNGAAHYVKNPIVPLDQHALMINFDMIGRIVNRRLNVSGANSAVGMEAWLKPIFDESPLDVVEGSIPGGSDHMVFMQREIPYLFAIIADFHDDYHTPEDVSWKINREDAVHAIHLFHAIAAEAATRTEPFEWKARESRRKKRSDEGDDAEKQTKDG